MKASPGRMRDNASDEYAGSRSLRDRSQARSLAGTVIGTRAMLSTRRIACSFTTGGALQGLGKGEATLQRRRAQALLAISSGIVGRTARSAANHAATVVNAWT